MLALIVFAILFFAIRKFVVPSFEKTFAERTQAIEGGLSAAETKQAEADAKLAELEKQLADARHEAARIREEAREQGAQIVAEMREQAQAESSRIVEHGKTQIEAERQQAVTSLRAEVGALATGPRRSHRRREPGRRGSPEPGRRALPRRPRVRRLDQHRERGQLMAGALRGASADALAALTSELESKLQGGADASRIGDDLFTVSVGAALRGRRCAGSRRTRPSMPAPRRAWSPRSSAARSTRARWTCSRRPSVVGGRSPRDLADALEHLSEVAVVRSAGDDSGRLADELFAFGQAVNDNPELRDALSDPVAVAGRQGSPGAVAPRGQGAPGDGDPGPAVAGRAPTAPWRPRWRRTSRSPPQVHGERVATVRVAHPLSDAERQRLTDALSRQYDRQIHLNVVVDPDVLGGIRSRSATTSSTAPSPTASTRPAASSPADDSAPHHPAPT